MPRDGITKYIYTELVFVSTFICVCLFIFTATMLSFSSLLMNMDNDNSNRDYHSTAIVVNAQEHNIYDNAIDTTSCKDINLPIYSLKLIAIVIIVSFTIGVSVISSLANKCYKLKCDQIIKSSGTPL